jgi:hypothetical protein
MVRPIPSGTDPLAVLKIGDDGHYPPMGVRVRLELQLLEDLCCVRLNRPFCDHKATGDGGVRYLGVR